MKQKKNVITICAAVAALIGLTIFTYVEFFGIGNRGMEDDEYQTYSSHYVLIADNTDKELWESVYASALAEAREKDAYLEMMGVNPSSEYSMTDYLEISMASHADGVLICPDGTKEVREMMKSVAESGIPVVNLMQDEPYSGRISLVGINSYEIGTLYESSIEKCFEEDMDTVMILQDSQEEDSMITNQIKNAINEKLNRQIRVETKTLQNDDVFETEEMIRDIFLDSDNIPDILICLNSADTECASQIVVDYNLVGDVQVVGYYTSNDVLSYIEKGIITSTISINTRELGVAAIDALEDYRNTGYTSDYVCVELSIVDGSNVADYMEEQE